MGAFFLFFQFEISCFTPHITGNEGNKNDKQKGGMKNELTLQQGNGRI
ncbi:hypothetical protein METH109765_05295 [Mesobacillus thioparans]